MALECTKLITPWYARVPTDSNLSDGPSRFSCENVIALGAAECKMEASVCWDKLTALWKMGVTTGREIAPAWEQMSVPCVAGPFSATWVHGSCTSFDSSSMLQWLTSGCKNDNVAVKPDSDLSLHARCGCTSAWFKRSFVMNVSMSSFNINVNSIPCHFNLLPADCGQSCFFLRWVAILPHPLPPFSRLQLT